MLRDCRRARVSLRRAVAWHGPGVARACAPCAVRVGDVARARRRLKCVGSVVDATTGLMDDILTINKLAPCFRKDGCQLMFASLTAMKGGLTDGNYREIARVGVKRVKLDGSDAVAGGNFKPLTYRQFMKVFKRMQAEADVALQAQMAQRGWVEPDRAAAQRVLMDDGTIVYIEEARKTGCLGRPAAAGAPHPPIALVRPPLARAPAAGEPGPAAVSGGSAESGPALAGSEAEEAAAEALSSIVHAMTEAV